MKIGVSPVFEKFGPFCKYGRMTQATDTPAPLPLPKRLLICPWGVSYTNTGQRIVVNDETLARMPDMQKQMGAEEVALDFEHNSFLAENGKRPDPLPVAAYGAPICERGRGVLLDLPDDKWTPDGAYYYANKHYRDVSPVLKFSADGETVIGVSSAALTRKGAINGLHAFSSILTTPTTMTPEEQAKIQAERDSYKKGFVELLASLGLSINENSTPEEILQAGAKYQETAVRDKQSSPEKDGGGETALSAQLAGLNQKVNNLFQSAEEDKKRLQLRQAVMVGKKLPLPEDKMLAFSAAQLGELLDALPAGEVPFSASSVTLPSKTETTLNTEQKELCARLGITEEAFSANLKNNR